MHSHSPKGAASPKKSSRKTPSIKTPSPQTLHYEKCEDHWHLKNPKKKPCNKETHYYSEKCNCMKKERKPRSKKKIVAKSPTPQKARSPSPKKQSRNSSLTESQKNRLLSAKTVPNSSRRSRGIEDDDSDSESDSESDDYDYEDDFLDPEENAEEIEKAFKELRASPKDAKMKPYQGLGQTSGSVDLEKHPEFNDYVDLLIQGENYQDVLDKLRKNHDIGINLKHDFRDMVYTFASDATLRDKKPDWAKFGKPPSPAKVKPRRVALMKVQSKSKTPPKSKSKTPPKSKSKSPDKSKTPPKSKSKTPPRPKSKTPNLDDMLADIMKK